MQFSTILTLSFVAVASVAALPKLPHHGSKQIGSCSTGKAQCCSTVHDGESAKSLKSLIGLDDVAGQVGLSCQQIPINAVGASAALQNNCKNTAVCCSGSHSNGLIQTSCTPLSVN